jgi:hypothetical protein
VNDFKRMFEQISPSADLVSRTNKKMLTEEKIMFKNKLKIAVTCAVCLILFSTAAYAVSHAISQHRLVTGGSSDFVVMPFDSPEYHELVAETVPINLTVIYVNRSNPVMAARFGGIDIEGDHVTFNADTAQKIRELLIGQIFIADGSAFELMSPAPLIFPLNEYPYYGTHCIGEYRADGRGKALYNVNGEEIATIVLHSHQRTREIIEADIWTIERWTAEFPPPQIVSHAQASEFLGHEIRLPLIHLDGFQQPEFRINPPLHDYPISRHTEINFAGSYFTDMRIHVQTIIDDNEEPWLTPVPNGTITELRIADTTVNQICISGNPILFTWKHDGLVYTFYPPVKQPDPIQSAFTITQMHEIIASMIEYNRSN